MINLNAILQSAQGGQAVDHLAARFGLTPDQTQSALNALLPALQMGLQNKVESGDLGSLVGHLGNGVHQEAYADPTAAQSPAVTTHGSSILGDLFGGAQTTTQVAQQAATESGVPASVIQAMLPVIVSMLMGGLMHGAQTGAFGGILSSVLGSLFAGRGGAPAGTPASPTPAPGSDEGLGGGLGGMLGSVLGGLFGNAGATTAAQQADTADEAAPTSRAPGSASDTLSEISDMFKAGTPAAPEHESQLASILGR